MSYVSRPDHETLRMSRAAQDHEAGVLMDWPDGYSARFEEGVRLLIGQRNRCQAHLIKARATPPKTTRKR